MHAHRAVFISSDVADRAIARWLRTALEAAGIRCLTTPEVENGRHRQAAFWANAIAASGVLIVIVSEAASRSLEVYSDVKGARDRGIPVIPVEVEHTERQGRLADLLRNLHWLHVAVEPIDDHIDLLIGVVKRLLN